MADLDACISRIAKTPAAFPTVRKTVRHALLRHFPHCVYFDGSESHTMVLGVLHGSRHPSTWRRRT
jgi:hypothetical protein